MSKETPVQRFDPLAGIGEAHLVEGDPAFEGRPMQEPLLLRALHRQRHQIGEGMIGGARLMIAGENAGDLPERRHGTSR